MMKKIAAGLLALLLTLGAALPAGAQTVDNQVSTGTASVKAAPVDMAWSFSPAETDALPGQM